MSEAHQYSKGGESSMILEGFENSKSDRLDVHQTKLLSQLGTNSIMDYAYAI